MTPYVELQVTSNYSFLRGASHAHELAHQAKVLGHEAIAIADRNTLAGAARMFVACRDQGIRMIVGTRLDLLEALAFAGEGKVHATVHAEKLENINDVFARMRRGDIDGRIVLDLA